MKREIFSGIGNNIVFPENYEQGDKTGIIYFTNPEEIKYILEQRSNDSKLMEKVIEYWDSCMGSEIPGGKNNLLTSKLIIPKQIASSELEVLIGFVAANKIGIDLVIPTIFEDVAYVGNIGKMGKFFELKYINSLSEGQLNVKTEKPLGKTTEEVREILKRGTNQDLEYYYWGETFQVGRNNVKTSRQKIPIENKSKLFDVQNEDGQRLVYIFRDDYIGLCEIIENITNGKTNGYTFDISKNMFDTPEDMDRRKPDQFYPPLLAAFGLFNVYMDDLDDGFSGDKLEGFRNDVIIPSYQKVIDEFGILPIVVRPSSYNEEFAYCINPKNPNSVLIVQEKMKEYSEKILIGNSG